MELATTFEILSSSVGGSCKKMSLYYVIYTIPA